MSFDLHVFCSSRPDVNGRLADFAPGDVTDHTENNGVGFWAIETRRHQVCSIDGPLRVEDEDVPLEVARAMLSVNWLVEISVPGSSPKSAVAASKRIAKGLAETSEGVVFDQQDGEVSWPRRKQALRTIPPRQGDNDALVELQWVFGRQLNPADAATLLAVLERSMPEALPKRFGDYEPMQGRLERDGAEAFTSLWGDELSFMFWTGTRPFADGYVSSGRGRGSALDPATREARRLTLGGREEQATDSLTLQFGAEVLEDTRWTGALRSLFRAVCAATDPFIAVALHKTSLEDQSFKLRSMRSWAGLPREAPWLTFIGEPYLSLARPSRPTESVGAGLLIEATARPDDPRVEAKTILGWNDDLVRRGDANDEVDAALVIPDLSRA